MRRCSRARLPRSSASTSIRDAVDHARRSYYAQNLRFTCGDATEIPLPDASIDVVACFETIEHVGEHDRLLDELRRVLVPGGVLVISSPNKLIYSDAANFSNPYHVKELYFAELRDLLARRFRHVALYGQRLNASSVVHPLAGAVSATATWFNGSAAGVSTGLPTLGDPMYFLAICSDEPLSGDLSSAYVDPSDDLLRDVLVELDGLRQDSAVALPAESNPRVALMPARANRPAGAFDRADHTADRGGTARDVHARRAGATVAAEDAPEATAEHAREVERLREQHASELAEARRAAQARADAATAEDRASLAALRGRLQTEAEAARTLHGKVQELENEARRAREAAASANAALHEERQRSERLMLQLAEHDRRRAGEGDAARGATEARDRAVGEAALLRAQVEALSGALQDARRDHGVLAEVLASRSWKVTEPLRRAASLIRR